MYLGACLSGLYLDVLHNLIISRQQCIFPQNDAVVGCSLSIKAVNINRHPSWNADKERPMQSANDTEFAAFTE